MQYYCTVVYSLIRFKYIYALMLSADFYILLLLKGTPNNTIAKSAK